MISSFALKRGNLCIFIAYIWPSSEFMMIRQQVEKPRKRSNLRKVLGKEFFILKRQVNWLLDSSNFAKVNAGIKYDHSLIKHQSFLLRPLKDVDMYLQHNKVTNLKIAIGHLDKVVIKPGQTFSIWRLTGRPKKSKGYLEGMVLHNGKIAKGTGGGLCQLGNLLYGITQPFDS